MTVKTANFRGDIYKNDKNAELRCGPAPIVCTVKESVTESTWIKNE